MKVTKSLLDQKREITDGIHQHDDTCMQSPPPPLHKKNSLPPRPLPPLPFLESLIRLNPTPSATRINSVASQSWRAPVYFPCWAPVTSLKGRPVLINQTRPILKILFLLTPPPSPPTHSLSVITLV